jgi:hypothetical protein
MTKTETTEESHFFSWSVLIFWIGVVFGFLTLIFLGGVLAGLKGAIFKKSASELESELLDAERAHQDKVETGAACPKCGFAFGWNGAECSHCNYFDSAGS